MFSSLIGHDLVRTSVEMDTTARQHWIRWYDENQATIHDAKGLVLEPSAILQAIYLDTRRGVII